MVSLFHYLCFAEELPWYGTLLKHALHGILLTWAFLYSIFAKFKK